MITTCSEFLAGKFADYKELAPLVLKKGDHQALVDHIEKHISQKDPMASLASRFVDQSLVD